MKWLIKSDKTFKAVRNIDNDVSEIKIENFIYYDSIETKNNFTSQNIFKKENKIHQYFTKTDADNFLLQIRRQSRSKWNLKIKNTIFLDTVELINNRLDKILYLYSFPLFSVDKKYVIIIESFYCGLLCGGGSYNLYERETNASWKKIKRFNIWAE